MRVTIENKARPCPGVERAISMAEDALRHDKRVFAVGELIHNSREIYRLKRLGLRELTINELVDPAMREEFKEAFLIVRAHGESGEVVDLAHGAGLQILNATCPIVEHSQDVVKQHVRDGWRIIIVGNHAHPEVLGLMACAGENGSVVSSLEEAKQQDFEDRSLILAQSTANPDLFHAVCKELSARLSNLKIMDTTCRFLRTRQEDIKAFADSQDIVLVIGGKKSSNVRLLFERARAQNTQTYRIEGPDEIDWRWFKNGERVGITGGASTPKWQLEEVRSTLENYPIDNNPKGLNNRKGGFFLWWMRKKSH
jgi:(E)-4-hydroxy-3-methyl-but-2-enyl pyrophosphate reductase